MHALVVALALALAGPPSPTSDVERLYVAGQDQYEARDYATAARTWTQLLEALPESEDNRAIRESVLINVLDAHLKAYELLLDHEGKKDIEHLRDATETLKVYYATFEEAHGDRVAMSVAVREKVDEVEAELRAAERVLERERVVPPALPPPPPPPPPRTPQREHGTGLVIGGSLLAAAGLACVSMIAIGSTRGRRYLRDYDAAEARLQADADDMLARSNLATADRNGRVANSMLIAGAVIAPLLVAGGATMIGLGVRKRRRPGRDAVTLEPGPGAFTLRF
jgi:hypothetical protein